ncbi:hypothetical protein E2C01_058360 [Portunus trituberculatus]|uniref:Uncharacterized protein n=1 Tax=Portunus trituberculatus TaxID=210409 RepID=A0A5B7H547_PORTR|nr:hypothetical protein [Portunus trituberculatus]
MLASRSSAAFNLTSAHYPGVFGVNTVSEHVTPSKQKRGPAQARPRRGLWFLKTLTCLLFLVGIQTRERPSCLRGEGGEGVSRVRLSSTLAGATLPLTCPPDTVPRLASPRLPLSTIRLPLPTSHRPTLCLRVQLLHLVEFTFN